MCSTQDELISFTSVAPQENLVWQTIELLFFWHKQKPCKNFHYSEQKCVLVIMVIGWAISFSYSFCGNIFNSGFKQYMFTRRSPLDFYQLCKTPFILSSLKKRLKKINLHGFYIANNIKAPEKSSVLPSKEKMSDFHIIDLLFCYLVSQDIKKRCCINAKMLHFPLYQY